jgi:hypothetical protein
LSAVTTVVMGPDVREAAERATTELLWLLDAAAEPTPDTLPALVEAGHVPAASLPVDALGEPVEAAVGRFGTDAPAPLLEAAQARRIPLRHTFVTSLLVDRSSVLDIAPPDPGRFGHYAGREWTARLFALHPAVLVPASTVRVGALGRGAPLEVLRAARAGGWGRGETVRELYRSVAD